MKKLHFFISFVPATSSHNYTGGQDLKSLMLAALCIPNPACWCIGVRCPVGTQLYQILNHKANTLK